MALALVAGVAFAAAREAGAPSSSSPAASEGSAACAAATAPMCLAQAQGDVQRRGPPDWGAGGLLPANEYFGNCRRRHREEGCVRVGGGRSAAPIRCVCPPGVRGAGG